jgi:hypothetical protein
MTDRPGLGDMPERRSTQEIRRYFQFHPPPMIDLLLELRGLVFKVAPHASERILWNGLAYHDHRIGGPVKGAICQLAIETGQVQIGFIHGAFLPDPTGLLQGERKSKRFLQVESLETTPWNELQALLASAAAYIQRWR